MLDPLDGGLLVFKDYTKEVRDRALVQLNRCPVLRTELHFSTRKCDSTVTWYVYGVGAARLQEVEAYAKADPYTRNGLVTEWYDT